MYEQEINSSQHVTRGMMDMCLGTAATQRETERHGRCMWSHQGSRESLVHTSQGAEHGRVVASPYSRRDAQTGSRAARTPAGTAGIRSRRVRRSCTGLDHPVGSSVDPAPQWGQFSPGPWESSPALSHTVSPHAHPQGETTRGRGNAEREKATLRDVQKKAAPEKRTMVFVDLSACATVRITRTRNHPSFGSGQHCSCRMARCADLQLLVHRPGCEIRYLQVLTRSIAGLVLVLWDGATRIPLECMPGSLAAWNIWTKHERSPLGCRFYHVFAFFGRRNEGHIALQKPRARQRAVCPPRIRRLVYIRGRHDFWGSTLPQERVWTLERTQVCSLNVHQIQTQMCRARERVRHCPCVHRQCFAYTRCVFSGFLLRSLP